MKFIQKVFIILLLVLAIPCVSQEKQDECKGWPKVLKRNWPTEYSNSAVWMLSAISNTFLVCDLSGKIWEVTTYDQSCDAAIIKKKLLFDYKLTPKSKKPTDWGKTEW